MLNLLRRLLSYPVSVEAMIEVALWLAIPYITIGVGWSFIHAEQVQQLQTQLETRLPAGADVAAFVQSTAMWPVLILAPDLCVR